MESRQVRRAAARSEAKRVRHQAYVEARVERRFRRAKGLALKLREGVGKKSVAAKIIKLEKSFREAHAYPEAQLAA